MTRRPRLPAPLPPAWIDAGAAAAITAAALASGQPLAVVAAGVIGWTCAWVSRDGD